MILKLGFLVLSLWLLTSVSLRAQDCDQEMNLVDISVVELADGALPNNQIRVYFEFTYDNRCVGLHTYQLRLPFIADGEEIFAVPRTAIRWGGYIGAPEDEMLVNGNSLRLDSHGGDLEFEFSSQMLDGSPENEGFTSYITFAYRNAASNDNEAARLFFELNLASLARCIEVEDEDEEVCRTLCTDPDQQPEFPEVWNANDGFDMTEHMREEIVVKDFYASQYGTADFDRVADPSAYYFGSGGRDQWSLLEMIAEVQVTEDSTCFSDAYRNYGDHTTDVLDLGLYFFKSTKDHRRVTLAQSPDDLGEEYFDPDKPTMVYVHGLNKESVLNHRREVMQDYLRNGSFIGDWKAEGYNVGIYYWNQVSDRQNPKNAESAIYEPDDLNRVKWKRSYGAVESNDASPEISPTSNAAVARLMAIELQKVRNDLDGSQPLRVVGHSLGAQMALHASRSMVIEKPDRIALLDPFWLNERESDVAENVEVLYEDGLGVPVEVYTSTFLNVLPRAWNTLWNGAQAVGNAFACRKGERTACLNAIRSLWTALDYSNSTVISANTCQVEILPDYPGLDINPFGPEGVDGVVASLTKRHFAATDFYFRSISEEIPELAVPVSPYDFELGEEDFIGDYGGSFKYADAKAVSARSCLNVIYDNIGHTHQQVKGHKTPTVSDDAFIDMQATISYYDQGFNGDEVEFTPGLLQYTSTNTIPSTRDLPLALGDPSDATNSGGDNNRLRIVPDNSYALSFNCSANIPNWASWHLSNAWHLNSKRGGFKRKDLEDFKTDLSIPKACRVVPGNYTCSGFAKGHLVASADRNLIQQDGKNTYYMSNMVPQNLENNSRVWFGFEDYLQKIVDQHPLEAYIVAGGRGQGGWRLNKQTGQEELVSQVGKTKDMRVPKYMWKAVVLMPLGENDLQRISSGTPFIAFGVWMENRNIGNKNDWVAHLKTINELETLLDQRKTAGEPPIELFDLIPENIQQDRFDDEFVPTSYDFTAGSDMVITQDINSGGVGNYYGTDVSSEGFTVNADGTLVVQGTNAVTLNNILFADGAAADISSCTKITVSTTSALDQRTTMEIQSPCPTNLALVSQEDERREEDLIEQKWTYSVAESEDYEIDLFAQPNPFTDHLRIKMEMPISEKISFRLVSPLGQVMAFPLQEQVLEAGTYNFDFETDQYPAGMYLLQLITEEEMQTLKVVKL